MMHQVAVEQGLFALLTIFSAEWAWYVDVTNDLTDRNSNSQRETEYKDQKRAEVKKSERHVAKASATVNNFSELI